ncbi:hypothetical protein KP509_04G039700 [Ceratopteris richardii]|uniref:Uncharacterized protein n=1 Tax=Ceratopteris richardii TaxID=49495 RepID=A0A8T2US76_CERRI|nr:hypothetical protein KP509_04G039700 [Ceratopteris richardii]
MASNPALAQLWLLPFAVIAGLLAYTRQISNNQAAICVVVLYLISRWHASRIQRRFEAAQSYQPVSSSSQIASRSSSKKKK